MEAAWNESAASSPSYSAYVYGDSSWPDPGWPLTNRPALLTGIFAVACGQVVVILYHFFHLRSNCSRIQKAVMPESSFLSDMMGHLAQPEGFVLLSLYLSGTWMFRLMPKSYYSAEGTVNPVHVFAQLVINDFFQTVMHLGEHKLSPWIYRMSHKPHHRFLNPKMFDAFNGSICDTIFMILLPLFLTAQIVHCNVWSYMAFGTIYASWLTLLHSEVSHPWDPLFRKIGFGTAGDHHVHHKCFIFNFGHLFMWWDMMFGTYK
ncbi:sterol desaturase [Guillardia theta CCMP2712]|uniref:Sterol desaturase n=2 Tax=Guillardia theta TaxID=55529 RepID=L1JQA8_GUITC|nr:sterol desaturase [Guillardia theta CCMP2712]EKX50464.1 sterol desaturase [Guillardia theta CCMP2712]|eukprot:XP_005837444.1 sterol desaturase [Guillardia theta CCMP2712]